VRILVSWLREFVEVPVGIADLASALTMAGFEVGSVEPAPDAQGKPDAVIDLEIGANRPDCLSVIGIAREVATIYRTPLKNAQGGAGLQARPEAPAKAGLHTPNEEIEVILEDADLCPRYAAALADVTIASSPAWLAARLHAGGIRPINNVVDVTNYVLLERGHPMHAFDLERLAGGTLKIRRARAGETLKTLDGEERKLAGDMLVIADADRPQAVAGVMGGAASEVSGSTKTIALESAYFHAPSVRRTSKRLGLKTEASARFERGADIEAPVRALERALQLLEQIGAGTRRGSVIDRYPVPHQPRTATVRGTRVGALLGQPVPDADIEQILSHLGFGLRASNGTWHAEIPSWRVDVSREVDLIEDVGRHVGYDNLPTTFPELSEAAPPPDPRIDRDRLVRRVLQAAGFSEACSFNFIEREAAMPFVETPDQIVAIANPLSEKFAVLRPSLLPGLIDALVHNRRRERRDVRLFEIGTRFTPAGEIRTLAAALAGRADREHWSETPRDTDFFDVKGAVEGVCDALGIAPAFEPVRAPHLVAGRAAAVRVGDGSVVGQIGLLTPTSAGARGWPAAEGMYVAEVDLDAIARISSHRDPLRVEPLPRFPSIVRDLSIVIDETLPAEQVRGTIRTAAPSSLVSIHEFARYQGKGIAEGRVSLSFHLTFRLPDRTLTDEEVQTATDRIVAALEREHGAKLR
jgi:phenylalanyl-tRNA synthetase beta chain